MIIESNPLKSPKPLCLECGKPLIKQQIKYCSRVCMGKSQIGTRGIDMGDVVIAISHFRRTK